MKKVVWGTGAVAAKYVGTLENDDISFFIDSDKIKQGTHFLGREVKMPEEVESWDDLQIYIQYNFFDEIAVLLRKKGLKEDFNFFKYYEPNKIYINDIDDDCKQVFSYINDKSQEVTGMDWYWGPILTMSSAYRDYLDIIQKSLEQSILTISEIVYLGQEESERRWKAPVLVLPRVFATDNFEIVSSIKDDCDYKTLLKIQYPELVISAKEYRQIYPNLEIEKEYLYIYKQANFIEKMLNLLKPKKVFILCSFPISHRVLAILCKKHNIQVIYTHKGALPKTWSFEIAGEMGESLPTVHAEKFLKLPIDENDISNAKKVYTYLKSSKINRKPQPKTSWLNNIKDKIKKGCPIIFYAGQNDVQSGLAYYGENAKIYHSPIFKSSIDAIPFLANLAERNNWNLLYKPHPMYIPTDEQIKLFPDNVIYVDFADINDIIDYSDVTITILSSTAYVALVREKPVVMLGYNQLRGKGCTYEAFTKEVIEETIKQALENGFTNNQKEMFTKHIAQLLKYYLYTDLDDGELMYGRPIPKSFDELYELADLLGVERNSMTMINEFANKRENEEQ